MSNYANINVLHLCSAICKALEALLVNHLYSAPSLGALVAVQAGFRTRHITTCCHYRRVQESNPFCQPARQFMELILKL